MSVREAVAAALEDRDGWQVEVALALAAEVDEKGTASAAKELRGVMAELGADKPTERTKETGLSDFERRLQERQAKAARRSASG